MLRVLSAAADDASQWTRLIEGLPARLRDIHYLPEYVGIYRDSHGYEPRLAWYDGGAGYVVQPFVLRNLGKLPFLAADPQGESYLDMANAYGYGGPLCNLGEREVARRLYGAFAGAFAAWCDEQDVASEFASLHPLLAEAQRDLVTGRLSPQHEKDVVVMDLAGDAAAIQRGMRKGHRSSVALARRSGVRVEKVAPSAGNVAAFGELYYATMRRRQAADRWFFPDGYFATCLRRLGESRSSLFFAYVGDALESACLLMHAYGTAYYHFAGTRGAHPELGVNNLLVLETALWAKSAGYARYHLGGGVTSSAEDSLMRFKAGFSEARAPLYTYFCVRDQVVYDRLCEKKRSHERATEGGESASAYLPLYRRQGGA